MQKIKAKQKLIFKTNANAKSSHKNKHKNFCKEILKKVLNKQIFSAKIVITKREKDMDKNKNKENKNSPLKKVTNVVGGIVAAGALAFAGVIGVKELNKRNNQPTHERLNQVVNVSYNEKISLLTWDAVEHANLYTVDVNGKRNNVETNSYTFMPTSNVSNIKVQAVDTSGEYNISKWSDVFTYTIPEDKLTTQKVFAFVDKLDINSKLVNIASLYINNNMLYSRCHVINNYGGDKVISYETSFDREINSLQEAMNAKVLGTDKIGEYDYSRYESAEYFLKSNSYIGQMEEYRKEGYGFEVVSSETIDKGIRLPMIYSTYRLTKGDEIKYIESSVDFALDNPSNSKSVNYTAKLQNVNERFVRELSFHELTGDFYEWANLTYESNQAKKNAQTNPKSARKQAKVSFKQFAFPAKEEQDEELEIEF